jgi:hypothetical protein
VPIRELRDGEEPSQSSGYDLESSEGLVSDEMEDYVPEGKEDDDFSVSGA